MATAKKKTKKHRVIMPRRMTPELDARYFWEHCVFELIKGGGEPTSAIVDIADRFLAARKKRFPGV